uniref:Uncharacterized protein n=1 Tax=Amphimedon queenslandica TaxID=400682 RepID=A0A1X7VUB2_AMPQE
MIGIITQCKECVMTIINNALSFSSIRLSASITCRLGELFLVRLFTATNREQ